MSSDEVKLRGNARRRKGPYPLGQIPKDVIIRIGKQLVHRIAIGHSDITGDDFGNIFANGVEGEHRESPLGIADVILDGCAWSVKTVKDSKPFKKRQVRLISGRNSPDYSRGITDRHKDPTSTGEAVLLIWNERINEALNEYEDLRIIVLVRNFSTQEFLIFEEEANRYITSEYEWEFNKKGNLQGFSKENKEHIFTWQPHGSQFTVKRNIHKSACKFIINKSVPIIQQEHIMRLTRFEDDWISIIG